MFLTFIIITKISKLTKKNKRKGKERIYFSNSKSKYFAIKKEELLIRSILKFFFYETNERGYIFKEHSQITNYLWNSLN